MSHKPPAPEASTPPWPATPAAAPRSDPAPEGKEQGRGSRVDGRIVAGVAGIAVGSAAIAAALLFAGRASKPKSASAPVPPKPAAPARSAAPDASDIEVA